jgi:TPR repeat protein
MIAAVLVLLLAGVGYYAYTNYIEPPQDVVASAAPPAPSATPATPAVPKKSVREAVAEYFATNPAPDAMLAKGKEFAQSGDMNAAFLVWRRAAEAGNVPAQVELASFYDPLVSPAKAGFTPDAQRAADWYERAALAGNAEAQRRFGLLLAKGGSGLPADQGRAKSWLQQAAQQNDAEAKKALETLPK